MRLLVVLQCVLLALVACDEPLEDPDAGLDGALDLRMERSSPDVAPDLSADGPLADKTQHPNEEASAPDLSAPDKQLPDLPAPDLPAPDLPPPDKALPDLPLPDLTPPDLPLPDKALPDLPLPDLTPPDLPLPDLPAPDAYVPTWKLMGVVTGGVLVTVDTATAKVTTVGPTGHTSLSSITFDPAGKVLYAVSDPFGTPKLISIDPCTGKATIIAQVKPATGAIHFMEGVAFNPTDGKLYAAASMDGTLAQKDYSSESLVTIHTTTGQATKVAKISGTMQNDGDNLNFIQGKLYVFDGDGTITRLYTVNPATGKGAHLGLPKPGYYLGDLAYHPKVKATFSVDMSATSAWSGTLVTLNLSTLKVTPIAKAALPKGTRILSLEVVDVQCP